jgi:hypothetical protein
MFLRENLSPHAFLLGLKENPCTEEVAFQPRGGWRIESN